jgi:hypothetical protein
MHIILAALILAACGGASTAPEGFKPVPGSNDTWSRDSAAGHEEYTISRNSFSGVLQDFASQVTIDALIQNGGGRLRGSVPFAACPGAAGLASFSLHGGETLQVGFAVHDGQGIRAAYKRPAGMRADPGVAAAMQNVLC